MDRQRHIGHSARVRLLGLIRPNCRYAWERAGAGLFIAVPGECVGDRGLELQPTRRIETEPAQQMTANANTAISRSSSAQRAASSVGETRIWSANRESTSMSTVVHVFA